MIDVHEIGCGEEWLDLDHGCKCIVKGKLESNIKPGDQGFIISDESWEVLYLDFHIPYSGERFNIGDNISVKATRSEDGLVVSSSKDIEKRI